VDQTLVFFPLSLGDFIQLSKHTKPGEGKIGFKNAFTEQTIGKQSRFILNQVKEPVIFCLNNRKNGHNKKK